MSDRSRRRYYAISPIALVLHFIDGLEYRVTEGFPKDPEFINATYNAERQEFGIVLRHDSFEPVPDGERLPEDTIEVEIVDENGFGDIND